MGETLLEVRDLDKRYPRAGGDVEVLRGCELALGPCETVAIMGPSGAGKSTFLNVLGGLDAPDRGELRYAGATVDLGDPRTAARWRGEVVGFVFQFHFLLPDFTALENLLIPVRGRGRVQDDDRARARRFLDLTGLANRANHLPG